LKGINTFPNEFIFIGNVLKGEASNVLEPYS